MLGNLQQIRNLRKKLKRHLVEKRVQNMPKLETKAANTVPTFMERCFWPQFTSMEWLSE